MRLEISLKLEQVVISLLKLVECFMSLEVTNFVFAEGLKMQRELAEGVNSLEVAVCARQLKLANLVLEFSFADFATALKPANFVMLLELAEGGM